MAAQAWGGLAMLGAALLLPGCVAVKPLGQMAVDSNQLVADTANEQTLMNILRAKDRMPMHFTSFRAVNGDLSISGSAGVGVDFPGDRLTRVFDGDGVQTGSEIGEGGRSAAPSISAAVESSPGFELAIYDNQEFQNGVLAPVATSTIEYYLQNGWPEDFLTALFVAKIDIVDAGGALVGSLGNSADEPAFERFLAATRMVPAGRPGDYRVLVRLDQLQGGISLDNIGRLDGRQYDIATLDAAQCAQRGPVGCTPGEYVVRRFPESKSVRFAALCEGLMMAFDAIAEAPSGTGAEIALAQRIDAAGAQAQCGTAGADDPERESYALAAGLEAVVYWRSPEAILYHLGAYVRCDLDPACSVYRLGTGGPRLIEVVEGRVDHALITARHLGRTYSLPNPDYSGEGPNHRGSQAIVLVQQLINLQKSADALPVSSSIRLRD